MKAMLLAAGVGSRLRPLTDKTPKALIDVGGAPMLERVVLRLKAVGVTELIVNVHHHAEKIIDYIGAKQGWGLRVEVSREDALLLDTGGGLKQASWFFSGSEPFFVHNADVLSDVDLRELYAAQTSSKALATLFVQDRPSKRKLLFTDDGRLLGRAPEAAPAGAVALGFSGVQAVSPRLFSLMTESGVFSLTDVYARLAAAEEIRAYRKDSAAWFDIGDPDKLEAARRWSGATSA